MLRHGLPRMYLREQMCGFAVWRWITPRKPLLKTAESSAPVWPS